jgi:CBS domain-containing protein
MAQPLSDEAELVEDVMTRNPITVSESASVQEAAQAMREADVGDVLVVRGDAVCGILTDRDIVVRFVADGGDPGTTPVGEICSPDLTEVRPHDPLDYAIELMRYRAIRRLPVVRDEQPVGILSLGDLAFARNPDSALADISAAPANT